MVTRREWVAGAALLAGCDAKPSGVVSAQEAVRHYLDRISEVDRLIHTVIELNPDAMRE